MSFLSRFEGRMEDAVEGAADRMAGAPLSPVQIAKKAEKQMRREKMVGAGKQYAPTLYTVLVSPEDDQRMFGYYPTLAGETETYLAAKAAENGLAMDGQPLVRFIVDDGLKHGKFDVIAEMVASPLIAQLRQEEMEHYGFNAPQPVRAASPQPAAPRARQNSFVPPNSAAVANRAFNPYVANNYEQEGEPDMYGMSGSLYSKNSAQSINHSARPAEAGGEAAQLEDIETGRVYPVASDRVLIGRESSNDIVLLDRNVSRYHAEIYRDQAGIWVLSDSGSTNGTFLNGRKIKSQPLRDGDRITLGTTSLEFQLF